MKNSILLFLFLAPTFLFAQYPNTGNKARLGYQTTGDGLIWRGVAADTVLKPRVIAHAYFQLDTVNAVLRRYIATKGSWQVVGGGGTNIDSLIYATRYWVGSNFFPLEGGTLTGTGGAGFIGFPSQVSAPGTPASGLNVFASGSAFNWKGTDGHERQFASTLTGGRTYTLPDISGTFALGTGTTDRLARWTGTNTLAAGNLSDNGTKLQALLPWQFHSWTTAGRPTGTTGYTGLNTTTGFTEGYFTSQWENYITSTGATSGQVSVFSSAGKTYGTDNFFWDNTNGGLQLISSSTAAGRGLIVRQTNNGIQAAPINFEKIRGFSAVQNGDIIGAFALRGYSGSQYITDNALFGGLVTGTVTTTSVPTSIFFNAGATTGNYNTQLLVHSGGNVGVGNFGSITSGASITAPSEKLHVIGSIYSTASIYGVGDIYTSSSTNGAKNIYSLNSSTGTAARSSLSAINGATTGGNRSIGVQSFSDGYTSSTWSSYVAGNYMLSGLANSAASTVNQKLFVVLGSLSTTTDTVETEFHRTPGSATISNTTRFAAISNRGFQIPSTTTTNRPNIKVGQYWVKGNTDSSMLEMKLPSGWEMIASRAYARALVSGLPTTNIYTANGILTGNRTITSGGFDLTMTGKVKIGSDSSFVHNPTTDTTFYKGDVKQLGNHYSQYGSNAGRNFPNLIYFKSNAAYDIPGTSYNEPGVGQFNWFILNDQRGYAEDGFGIKNENLHYVGGPTSYATLFTIRNNGSLELGYPGVSRMTRVNSDSFSIEPSYLIYPTVTNAAFYVIGKSGREKVVAKSKFYIGQDSTLKFDPANDLLQLNQYGAGNKEAADLSKTQSNYIAGFATDGTLLDLEQKRDTTIYVVDTDYDFSAALTTSQVSRRYNRIIFLMTTTAGAGSDSELTLHTPDSNLMQVEYLIRSTDETGGFTNVIKFGTNNAVASDNALASTYTPSPGQGVGIRAGLRSGVYKYFYY